MTLRYVGPGGNDGNSGLTWALRKLTLNGVEDTPVAAGDIVYVAPGTYREMLTVDVSGGNTYSTGTVSVTNGSTTVTGAGTLWLANVAANYIFHVTVIAHGVDGVTDGTATFTSVACNFQAGMIGMTIRINTKAAAIIAAVGGLTSITLADTAGAPVMPAAGVGLTYDVGPEPPYNIASVTDDTHLELTTPWSGPTLTGLAYLTYNPIRYVGDYTGANTDGAGGIVRITGADVPDQAAARANCIVATAKNYRLFQGFQFDITSNWLVAIQTTPVYWTFQDCICLGGVGTVYGFSFLGVMNGITIRRCAFYGSNSRSISITHTALLNNAAVYIENCVFWGPGNNPAIGNDRTGGVTIKNCTFFSPNIGIRVQTALTVGQAVTANDCIISSCVTGISATAVGEILEDYNDIWNCNAMRISTTIGAHSNSYPPLWDSHWFFEMINGGRLITSSDLVSYSALVNLAGFNPARTDMRNTAVIGAQREWGSLEYDPTLVYKPNAANRTIVGQSVTRTTVW
jgi:hypothetical protein